MSTIVAIEGIDGVGKGTQTKMLYDRLVQSGKRVLLLSFPVYTGFFGAMVGQYLNGYFGTLDNVHPKQAALLYAMDRWETFKKIDTSLYDVIVIDRYVPSNMAHQGGRAREEEKKSMIDWITDLEYKILGLPVPDLVILLDTEISLAAEQILKKKPRLYTDKNKDLHEQDDNYLCQVRDMFLELSNLIPYFKRIQCNEGNIMRTVDDIHSEIWSMVSTNLK